MWNCMHACGTSRNFVDGSMEHVELRGWNMWSFGGTSATYMSVAEVQNGRLVLPHKMQVWGAIDHIVACMRIQLVIALWLAANVA
jgi:hypothetical protein